jgi:hypothetical protein
MAQTNQRILLTTQLDQVLFPKPHPLDKVISQPRANPVVLFVNRLRHELCSRA